jgi:hypothetical protein
VSRNYVIDVDLPQRLAVTSVDGAPQANGSKLHWSLTQAPASAERALNLVLDTAQIRQSETKALTFAYSVNGGTSDNAVAAQVFVEGFPIARIENNATYATTAKPGASVKVSTTGTIAARATDTLTYKWHQTAGPSTSITGADTGSYSVSIPKNINAATSLKYELVVSNGRRDSNPATLEINVSAPTQSGGGGAIDLWWLTIAASAFIARLALRPTRWRAR